MMALGIGERPATTAFVAFLGENWPGPESKIVIWNGKESLYALRRWLSIADPPFENAWTRIRGSERSGPSSPTTARTIEMAGRISREALGERNVKVRTQSCDMFAAMSRQELVRLSHNGRQE